MIEIFTLDFFTSELILLCLVALCAGFIDSIVGGGGLLQIPAMLILLPQYPVATLFGTTKIPSITGTAFSAYKYTKVVSVDLKLLLPIAALAFIGAVFGAYAITQVGDAENIKPLILFLLIAVAIYTYTRKDFGQKSNVIRSQANQLILGLVLGFVIGFYDGMIGPGAGTFLLLVFVSIMGYDFLKATASAKYVNVATNIAAIIYFVKTDNILYEYAIPMAVFNLLGAYLGVKLALLKGNKFIRVFFLVIIFATILRFSWDVFSK